MIDSIYTGITGVRSHQERLNVIGNNVANINTTAFKAGRVTFGDVMSQTLSEGTAASGGVSATNPKQTGLGVKVTGIDTIQTQGSLQQTGIETDLAVEGDGMFVLTDGTRDFYTRDGTFAFDETGKFVDPSSGLALKGHLATGTDDATGDTNFDAELKELSIPLNRESEAQATTMVQLAGNLDAAGGGAAVWTEDTVFGLPATAVGMAPAGVAAFSTALGTDPAKLNITFVESGVATGGTLIVPNRTYADMADLRGQLNALVYANDSLRGKVQFLGDATTDLSLRSISGGPDISFTIDDDPTSVAQITNLLGFTPAAPNAGVAVSSVAGPVSLNDLANVGEDLTAGDIIRFTGVKQDGQRFDGQLISTGADTIDDLFSAVQGAYGGVVASLDPTTGRMILNEAGTPPGDRVNGFDISFSLVDQPTTTRADKSALVGAEAPFSFSTNTQVFDAEGESHSLTFTFTKGLVANEWLWSGAIDGFTPEAGNVGTATFNPDGTIETFESTDGLALQLTPTNGTSSLTIEIAHTDPTGQLGGLTQFVASSSVAVRDQDGRASGNLVSVSIEGNGHIRGLFDNGDSQVFARVPLAVFGNPGGLRREGENLFMETTSSGTARTGEATTEIQGLLRSGHVEMSNVDLAEEFTNMIVTQRGFQASARTITTSDEMLAELVNLKR